MKAKAKKRRRMITRKRYTAKLTEKYEAIIPTEVRRHLHLKKKDQIVYELLEDGTAVIRKTSPLDLEYLNAVSETLNEWNSDSDERAYRDL
jgi:antitoxin PrlF